MYNIDWKPEISKILDKILADHEITVQNFLISRPQTPTLDLPKTYFIFLWVIKQHPVDNIFIWFWPREKIVM